MAEKRNPDKQKALDSALSQIERQFGKGSIMKLGGDNPIAEIEATSTGSLGLDIALGIGGLPKGRIIEIYGPESSGKTTLTLHCVAEEQKKGGICAFVDAEHALDPQYAKKLGVDLDELLISQPDTGEQALEITDTLVRSGAVSMVIVDSVAALTPKSELEGDMGDSNVGVQARLMSQAMRKLTGSIARSNCMVIFINQIRIFIESYLHQFILILKKQQKIQELLLFQQFQLKKNQTVVQHLIASLLLVFFDILGFELSPYKNEKIVRGGTHYHEMHPTLFVKHLLPFLPLLVFFFALPIWMNNYLRLFLHLC